MILALPLLAGAIHVGVTCPLPGTADGDNGADGTVGAPIAIGVSGSDCNPVPFALSAATLSGYFTPFVSPVMDSEFERDARTHDFYVANVRHPPRSPAQMSIAADQA